VTLERVVHASHHELVAHAHRIAALLVRPGRVVLTCKHAQSFVPGLLAAWLTGTTVDLLPNVQAGTLDRVDEDPTVAYVLHDGAERQARSDKAIYLPDVLAAGTSVTVPARPLPSIAARMTTSGTTERPRYVEKAMAELLDELDVLAQIIAPAHCVLATVPFSQLYGLLFGALLPLRFGARIVSHDKLLPADLATILVTENVDLLVSTPAHLRAMALEEMPRGLRVVTSGARLPSPLHERLLETHGWQVTDVLGSTETGGIATRTVPGGPWTPFPRVQVSASPPEYQLTVASPWSPRITLDDRVEIFADGTFNHLSRASELVKIAGKRAHAHELEATIRAVPDVTDAAVLVYAAEGKEARVAAAIVGTADRSTIADAIRRQFDPVFVPRILKFVTAIPRSDRGKIDGTALRGLLGLADSTSTIPFVSTASGRYTATVPEDLVFFRGHFEGDPILPGAVLVERLVWPIVQAELGGARMTGMKRLRFHKPVRPGDHLEIVIEHKPEHLTFEVRRGELVASGQLFVT
jgi:acyl-coenzyme A synthetase/AMP-(fatty) acid ligase